MLKRKWGNYTLIYYPIDKLLIEYWF